MAKEEPTIQWLEVKVREDDGRRSDPCPRQDFGPALHIACGPDWSHPHFSSTRLVHLLDGFTLLDYSKDLVCVFSVPGTR